MFLLYDALVSLAGILKASFMLSIPVFLFSFLAINLRNFLKKKHNLNWLSSTFLTIFIISVLLCFVAYFYFVFTTPGVLSEDYPPGVEPNTIEYFYEKITFILGVVFRRILIGLIFSIIIFPFAFLGSFLQDFFNRKLKHSIISLYLACFFCNVLFFAACFFFDFLIPGLYYILFYF